MIVRIHSIVLLCSVAGYFTTINAIYLNFASPNKALNSFENEAEPIYPKNLDRWFRQGTSHKKLVILDRKDKQVNEFVKKLINVIEKHEVGELLNKLDKRKMNCRHVSFGSIYNARAKRRLCKKQQQAFIKRQPWINFVIPLKKSDFIDSSRQGFSNDYLIDFNRRADIDFDYYNSVNRARVDNKKEYGKDVDKGKKNKETLTEVNARRIKERVLAKGPQFLKNKRFEVINNRDHISKYSAKHPKTNNPDKYTDTKTKNDLGEDTDSDYNYDDESNPGKHENPTKTRQPKTKKISNEWNAIMKIPDVVRDSSEPSKPGKQKKSDKKTYEADNSSENNGEDTDSKEASESKSQEFQQKQNSDNEDIKDFDSDTKEDFKPNKKKFENEKGGSYKEKYVYMQGHRLFNSNKNSDNAESLRRMRDRHYFLPKRSIWNEETIKHLGYYWNSHETFDPIHV